MGLYDSYALLSPKRAAALRYGSRLRYLKCLQAQANHLLLKLDMLTPEERNTIDEISVKAQIRAKETFEREIAAINSRASTEQRQYEGK